MKALYLHGFLSGPDDMNPFFLNGVNSYTFDLRDLKYDELLESGPYDFAIGYSFGGRVLAKCLEIDSKFVSKPIFCSSRITPYTSEELNKREAFKSNLLKEMDVSAENFFEYWQSLDLFNGHKMSDFRKTFKIEHKPWSSEQIKKYLEFDFTFPEIDLKGFEQKSLFLYGGLDTKYKKEGQKLNMKSFEFKDLGHRFLFENPETFKNQIKNYIQIK